jgi:hypothetical protein
MHGGKLDLSQKCHDFYKPWAMSYMNVLTTMLYAKKLEHIIDLDNIYEILKIFFNLLRYWTFLLS